jgi:hypothetical protein
MPGLSLAEFVLFSLMLLAFLAVVAIAVAWLVTRGRGTSGGTDRQVEELRARVERLESRDK